MPFTVGLTGGVASGKSLAATMFEKLGVPVLDADQVSRDVVAPPSPVLDAIVGAFGNDMRRGDGTLDRARLRALVFADPAARKKLEGLTHPAIRTRLRQWRDAQTAPYCVLSAAILFEAGFDALVDRVLVVDADPQQQIQRLIARDGIASTLAQQMLAAQMDGRTRCERADDVLSNTGSAEALSDAVKVLHARYRALAGAGSPGATQS